VFEHDGDALPDADTQTYDREETPMADEFETR
jgi:hypothetical protein